MELDGCSASSSCRASDGGRGKVALIARDEASQVAAHTFVEQLPGSLSACTFVAADVSGAMRWLGRA
jgi:hypothetical protein